ncbi:MAG: hypothetical protein IKF19_03870 [Bacilli bacterium]|nr:hypothetical protein [Bacilli bacterium]
MKKIIKKILIPISISVICGFICAKLVYEVYDSKIEEDLNGKKIYLIQAGAYDSYDNMLKNTSLNNYVYYEDDDGLFKSIIGITENSNNIDKIKNSYGKDTIIKEYYSKDDELNKKIKELDQKLERIKDNKEIQKIVLDTLNLYKDNKKTLVKISS